MARQRRELRLVGVAPLIAMLVSCGGVAEEDEEPQSTIEGDPPAAVAPPDAGVEPPRVMLLRAVDTPLAPEDRPQAQLSAWSESMSEELNIPRTALQAYGYAARSIEVAMPHCGLTWPLLAGIGEVESSHGRYGGAKLDDTGRPSIRILGIPLDGRDGVKRIQDTDGGALDGDTEFDRAVGPLQFIPKTWRDWASDADGDGVADPHDLDDAALAAGKYLCSVGGDLRQPERFWGALLTYNESEQYVQDVLDHADQYGRTSRTLTVKW